MKKKSILKRLREVRPMSRSVMESIKKTEAKNERAEQQQSVVLCKNIKENLASTIQKPMPSNSKEKGSRKQDIKSMKKALKVCKI